MKSDAPLDSPARQDVRTEETRRHLIEAAIELFGERGYDGVSTRQITRIARANLSSITYHFGSKEGLYEACLCSIIDKIEEQIGPRLVDLEQHIKEIGQDRQAIAQIIAEFTRAMLSATYQKDEMRPERTFLMREHAMPSKFFHLFYQALPNRMLSLSQLIVVAATDMKPGSLETRIRAIAFTGQIMIFQFAKAVTRAHLELDDIDEETSAMVAEQVALSMCASLNLPTPQFNQPKKD